MITEENVNWNADNSVSKQEIGDVHPKGREEEKGQEYQKKKKNLELGYGCSFCHGRSIKSDSQAHPGHRGMWSLPRAQVHNVDLK